MKYIENSHDMHLDKKPVFVVNQIFTRVCSGGMVNQFGSVVSLGTLKTVMGGTLASRAWSENMFICLASLFYH